MSIIKKLCNLWYNYLYTMFNIWDAMCVCVCVCVWSVTAWFGIHWYTVCIVLHFSMSFVKRLIYIHSTYRREMKGLVLLSGCTGSPVCFTAQDPEIARLWKHENCPWRLLYFNFINQFIFQLRSCCIFKSVSTCTMSV